MAHSELRKNEYCITNVEIGKEWTWGFFDGKEETPGCRLGKVAYNQKGQVITGYRPVFKQRWYAGVVNGKLIRIYTELYEIHPDDLSELTSEEIEEVNRELMEERRVNEDDRNC